MSLFEADEYQGKTFKDLSIETLHLEKKQFEQCVFEACIFKEAILKRCRFVECSFLNCDLSLSLWQGSSLSEVSFNQSNLSSINWTLLQWPVIKLCSPMYFDGCNLSYASFYSLTLRDLFLERCRAHECDFREAVLSQASFAETDLSRSLFTQTDLSGANFVDAINYYIDTKENVIKGATFSFPDVMNLLRSHEIKIVGYNDFSE